MIYVFEWHSRGQRFDPAYLHHKDLKQLLRVFFVCCRSEAVTKIRL